MANYQEIVTKAVIGKGKKQTIDTYEIEVNNNPSKVLGCWIINNKFTSFVEEEKVYVEGDYDAHIWYGCNEDCDTSLIKETMHYKEEIPFKMKQGENLSNKIELKGYCSKYPTCSSLFIENSKIIIKVDKDFIVDAIGEAIIKVQVSQVVVDEWSIDEEIDKNVNIDYIKENKKTE